MLKLAKPEQVYAEVEGRLVDMPVKNGAWVTKDGDILASLSNPEKQKEFLQRQQDHDIAWFKALWYDKSPEPENRAQAKQFEKFAEKLEPAIKNISDQIGKLTLVSHRTGQVVMIGAEDDDKAGQLIKPKVGQWLKPGKPYCEIGDPHKLEAHLILDQTDIHLIKPDNEVWLKIYGKSETTYKSRVAEIAPRTSEEVPTELSNMASGEVASKPDPKTGSAKPLTAVYELIIPVDNSNLELEPGLRGFAKIDGGSYTLAWWLHRWWNKVFNFQL